MFYTAELFINKANSLQPIENANIDYAYETYEDAEGAFKIIVDEIGSGHFSFNSDKENEVIEYAVDIFHEYCHVYLLIKAVNYDMCENVFATWSLDYLNSILKEEWLKDRMKDLPTWFVIIGHEAPEAPIDILHIESVDPNSVPINEVSEMFTGWYTNIDTDLANIIMARKYDDDFDEYKDCYDLIIQAEDEDKVKDICKDFIRLYVDEHE